MPLTRKQQILAAIETNDGTPVTLTGADAVLVFDPDVSDDVTFLDRVPAGPSMSRANTPPGLTTRGFTFSSDLVGSGNQANAPPWGKFARAAAHRERALIRIPVTALSGVFQPGEIVQKTANDRAVCVTLLTADGDVYAMPLEGTISTGGTLTGESSGATGTIGTVATSSTGYGYTPDSERQINLTTGGAFTPSEPVAGDTVVVRRTGSVVGAIRLVVKNTSTDWDGELMWGTALNGDTLEHDGATNTATHNANPTQIRSPSLTIQGNKDGFERKGAGQRGSFTMSGAAGEPLSFAWDFSGQSTSHADALPTVTSGLGSQIGPRLFGSIVGFGKGADFFRMPVRSMEYTPANTISDRLDANAAGGTLGTAPTDRDPSITVEVEQTGKGVFDWIGARDAETPIRFGAILGTGTGLRVGVVAANCQVTELPDGDADGFATFNVTLKPRRILEQGDDELVLFNY